jgi:flagellar biosynthesis protein FlhG
MSLVDRQFWTIGGGKGGVGKSFLTASLATALARMSRSVVAVDADLGSSNLHTYLGIRSPARTLVDYLDGKASAEEVLLPTSLPNLRLLSCASDLLGMADPTSTQKSALMGFIASLKADYVLVDLGGGSSANVLDFFNMSDEGIVVVSPDPASMQSAYMFLKCAVFRRIERTFDDEPRLRAALQAFRQPTEANSARTMMDFYDSLCTHAPKVAQSVSALVDSYRPLLIVNMAASDEEQRVAEILQSVSRKFLNVNLRFCGLITADPAVRRAAQQMTMFDFEKENGPAASQIRRTVERLLNGTNPTADYRTPAPTTPVMGFNDSLEYMGRELHIQTEDLGYTGRSITTQVFYGGRVIYSARTEYPATAQDPCDRSLVIELMRKQHFNVMREIESKKGRNDAAR